jgi:hypothetical protein
MPELPSHSLFLRKAHAAVSALTRARYLRASPDSANDPARAGIPSVRRRRLHSHGRTERRSIFDGIWSVVIVTEVVSSSSSDREWHRAMPTPSPTSSDESIGTALPGSPSAEWAHGLGRLSTQSGSGTWTSPSAKCRALDCRATRRCLALLGLNSRPDYIKSRLRRARYDSFRHRPNCRVLRSPSADYRNFRHAIGAWSRGLRCRTVLNQYGIEV